MPAEQALNRRKKRNIPSVFGLSVDDAACPLKEERYAEKSKRASLVKGNQEAARLKKMFTRRRWEYIVIEPTVRVAKIPSFPK